MEDGQFVSCPVVDGGAANARECRRIGRSRKAIDVLRAEIDAWFQDRRDDDRFARFARHFDALEAVLVKMLARLSESLVVLRERGLTTGDTYRECRQADKSLRTVERTFRWYSSKYDQRLVEEWKEVLGAADELVRSCWSEPFVRMGLTAPTGPLPYLDPGFEAFATPRKSIPPDLRAPNDALVAELVAELPVPTIALPSWAVSEPWWLVLAAHETGHHVLKDLVPGLEAAATATVANAVAGSAAGDDRLTATWCGWTQEIFADAYAVLMVGESAAWAVDELQLGPATELAKVPEAGSTYPPPLVRTALLAELARAAGIPGTGLSVEEAGAWLDGPDAAGVAPAAREAVARHLGVVREVAEAVIAMSVGSATLSATTGLSTKWFERGGRVPRWTREMQATEGSFGEVRDRPAARQLIAAAVRAWAGTADVDGVAGTIRTNLLDVLPRCGEAGVLAAEAEPDDLAALADRLAAKLLEAAGPDG
jgi:hypothetical protein